jgi:hypothetical protein
MNGRAWRGLTWLRMLLSWGLYEHGNEPSILKKKVGKFREKLTKISYSQKMTALHVLSRFCKSAL